MKAYRFTAATLGLCALLASCGKSEKWPEAYGVYVSADSAWSELQKQGNTLGRNVRPDMRIAVFDKRIAMGAIDVEIEPRVFIRNVITQNPDGSGKSVAPSNAWSDGNQNLIDGQILPVEGKSEMVVFRPRNPLKPGAYSVRAMGQTWETVKVDLDGLLAHIQDTDFCFDRIETKAFGIPMGVKDRFSRCSEADKAQAGERSLIELNETVSKHGVALPESTRPLFKRVVDGGVNPNQRAGSWSLLSIAAQSGFEDLVEVLLEKGADINGGADDGSPLYWAISEGRHSVAAYLMKKGADVNRAKSGGWTPLNAVENKMDPNDPRTKEVVEMLKQRGAQAH